MKRLISTLVITFGWASAALAAEPGTLTSLRAIHALSNAEASHSIPVAFEATVTFYDKNTNNLFVQDGGLAVYVESKPNRNLVAGDRVLVSGRTRGSFRPDVVSDSETKVGRAPLPKPVDANFEQMIGARRDCMRVTVRAEVKSADLVADLNRNSIYLRLRMDGGYIDAAILSTEAEKLSELLDAEVEITGVVSGRFDNKFQLTGILLEVNTLADLKILKHTNYSIDSLPVTPMDDVLAGYHVDDLRRRIRVQGTITYYEPGFAAVLQSGDKSIWIATQSEKPLRVGDFANATGFGDVNGSLLALNYGDVQDTGAASPIVPLPVTRSQLASGDHAFDLVSIEGKILARVRQGAQDEYVLVADGQVFPAVYHHPDVASGAQLPPMKDVPVGSTVRGTGISMVSYGTNPLHGPVSFSLLLRSFDDIQVVAAPSWLSVRTLVRVAGLLALVIIAFAVRQWNLQRKVHLQTVALASRIEEEAAMERRITQLEQRRSQILEDINGSRPLAEIIEKITDMVSLTLGGAGCRCEIADGPRLGAPYSASPRERVFRQHIMSHSGKLLGTMYANFEIERNRSGDETEALKQGAQLATLAIETRQIYSDLVYRSEFDPLTDVHNRFSLGRHLESLIEEVRDKAGVFGLIYIDLDGFKQINDLYGHHVGDLYLQGAALRMKRQLRAGDILARFGGDEFVALFARVRSRVDVEEAALRVERCFDDPFVADGVVLHGSASVGVALYPENGSTSDEILTSADSAMYAAKQAKCQTGAELPFRTNIR